MTPRRRASMLWHISLAVVAVVAAVFAAWREQQADESWQGSMTFTLALVLALMTCADSLRKARAEARKPGEHAAQARAQKVLVSMVLSISRNKEVRATDLGASLYVPQPSYRRKGWGWVREEHLVRVLRLRLDDLPQPSHITWLRGKGAVGRAWVSHSAAHWFCSSSTRMLLSGNPKDDQLAKVPVATVDGLSRNELLLMINKYREVRAVPITDDEGDVVGILSLDLTSKCPVRRHILATSDVEETMIRAGLLLRADLDDLFKQM